MSEMRFPRVVAFVEGTMEKFFVNNNFHYVHLFPVSNGNGWSLAALCEQIAALYRANDPNPDLVCVWIDLERQECGSSGVAAALESALIAAGAPPERICVCVPDRMTENAILADEQLIRETFGLQDYIYSCEGSSGKAVLKNLYAVQGINYKETRHGAPLLKRVRLARSAAKSDSVRSFYERVKAVPCWWVEDIAA